MTNTTDTHLIASSSLTFRRHLQASLFALLTLSGMATAQQQYGDLTVIATGFKNSQGHAIARLYLPGNEVTKKGQQEISATINNEQQNQIAPKYPNVFQLLIFT